MEPELMAKQKPDVLKRKSEKTGEMQKGETDHVAPKEAERANISVCLFFLILKLNSFSTRVSGVGFSTY